MHALCTCACVRAYVYACVCAQACTYVRVFTYVNMSHTYVCVCVRVRLRACACEGIEGALPLGVLFPEGQPPNLFVHLGGLEGRLGRLSRPVPVYA